MTCGLILAQAEMVTLQGIGCGGGRVRDEWLLSLSSWKARTSRVHSSISSGYSSRADRNVPYS